MSAIGPIGEPKSQMAGATTRRLPLHTLNLPRA